MVTVPDALETTIAQPQPEPLDETARDKLFVQCCQIGLALGFQGNYTEAAPHFERAHALQPSDDPIRNNLFVANSQAGLSLALQGNYAEATPYFERAHTLQPNHEAVRNNLFVAHCQIGSSLSRKNEYAEAIPHFERAHGLKPDDEGVVNNLFAANSLLGSFLVGHGDYVESLPYLKQAHALQPDNVGVHNGLFAVLIEIGIALAHQGHMAEARLYLEQAHVLKPDKEDVFKYLFEALPNIRISLSHINNNNRASTLVDRDITTKIIDYAHPSSGHKRKKILFIMDKWHSALIGNGISEWERGFIGCLNSTSLDVECIPFHFDDFLLRNGHSADDDLLELCRKEEMFLAIIIAYRQPGSHASVPTYETLHALKNELNIPVVAIYGDIYASSVIKIVMKLLPCVTLNVCTASKYVTEHVAGLFPESKFDYYWVPKDQRIFYPNDGERDIPVSYIGSPKSDRMLTVKHLRDHGIEVYCAGGEGFNRLDISEYADILRRSRITLSFSRSLGFHVTNARVFEAALCGAMILEEDGDETRKLFTPLVDYVPYSSLDDLVVKATYYLANDRARSTIAVNGCRKCHSQYSATQFWESIFNQIRDPGAEPGPTGEGPRQPAQTIPARALSFGP